MPITYSHQLGIAYELLIWTTIEMHGNIICASAPAIKALVSAYFTGKQGSTSLDSLVGQKGTFASTVHTDNQDWPLRSDISDDMKEPRVMIEEKPPTPPKDNYKGWEDGPYGGIIVTERYSVVSTNVYGDPRRDGSRKGRKVLGF